MAILWKECGKACGEAPAKLLTGRTLVHDVWRLGINRGDASGDDPIRGRHRTNPLNLPENWLLIDPGVRVARWPDAFKLGVTVLHRRDDPILSLLRFFGLDQVAAEPAEDRQSNRESHESQENLHHGPHFRAPSASLPRTPRPGRARGNLDGPVDPMPGPVPGTPQPREKACRSRPR
jgi:hypothetical protein